MDIKVATQLRACMSIARDAMRLSNSHGIEKGLETEQTTIALSNYVTQAVGNSVSSYAIESVVSFVGDNNKRKTVNVLMRSWVPARAVSDGYGGKEVTHEKGNSNAYLEKIDKLDFVDMDSEVAYLATYLVDGILKGYLLSGETGVKAAMLYRLTIKPLALKVDSISITRKVKSKVAVQSLDYSWSDIKHGIAIARQRHVQTLEKIPVGEGKIRGRAQNMDF